MTTVTMLYVCDLCGLLHAQTADPEDGEWECGHCGSCRAWEFPEAARADAEHHSRHIAKGIGKGSIFHRATRAL